MNNIRFIGRALPLNKIKFIYMMGLLPMLLGLGRPFTVAAQSPTVSNRNDEGRAEELRAKIAAKSDELEARIELARLLNKQSKFAEAIGYLKNQSDKLPRHGLLVLAKAYRGEKDYLNEVRTLTFMLSADESDYVGETLLARAHFDNQNLVEAAQRFRHVIKVNTRYQPAYEGLLKIFDYKKARGPSKRSANLFESRQLLEQMVGIFTDVPEYRTQLCAVYAMDPLIEKAIARCARNIELNPEIADNYVNLAQAYAMADKKEASMRTLRVAVKKFPQSAAVLCAAGKAEFKAENLSGAIQYFKRSVSLDPGQTECQLGLARAAFGHEDYQLALDSFVVACQQQRELTGELRRAAGLLRRKKKDEWQARYSQAVGKCINI